MHFDLFMKFFSLVLGGGAGQWYNLTRSHHPNVIVHGAVNPRKGSACSTHNTEASFDELGEATFAYRVLQLET
jgi:hypothetical protein